MPKRRGQLARAPCKPACPSPWRYIALQPVQIMHNQVHVAALHFVLVALLASYVSQDMMSRTCMISMRKRWWSVYACMLHVMLMQHAHNLSMPGWCVPAIQVHSHQPVVVDAPAAEGMCTMVQLGLQLSVLAWSATCHSWPSRVVLLLLLLLLGRTLLPAREGLARHLHAAWEHA